MYWVTPYWIRAEFVPVWMTSMRQAIDMIGEAAKGERNDELFYDDLIKLAPSEDAAKIEAIRDDERVHSRMFREMYKDLTGRPMAGAGEGTHEKPKTYAEGLRRALEGELSAVERYRNIWFGLPAGIYKDTVFGIMLDELKHASTCNYLLSEHRTNS
ncbi:ferritin-like domain-containing protein [Paenibacillus sp. GYB003]|uniref:ferritin-like domain-containing protein n=1 Tax=Paenibacillus sp. GYB003 TaxID=2994392 RepID=UPI002F965FC7